MPSCPFRYLSSTRYLLKVLYLASAGASGNVLTSGYSHTEWFVMICGLPSLSVKWMEKSFSESSATNERPLASETSRWLASNIM